MCSDADSGRRFGEVINLTILLYPTAFYEVIHHNLAQLNLWLQAQRLLHIHGFYPSLQSRVEYLQVPDVGHGVTYRERFAELSKSVDPRQVITRWLELTARMLALGYVPATATNVGRG